MAELALNLIVISDLDPASKLFYKKNAEKHLIKCREKSVIPFVAIISITSIII